MKRYPITIVICAVAFVAAATTAIAGEGSGLNVVVAKPIVTTDLGNGMVYETRANSQVCITTDPDHPLNRASGDCHGACIREGDGEPTCMGSCTWVDSAGELVFFTWTGENEGTWTMQGGTGKWTNVSGGGTWTAAAVYASGMVASSWQGSIEME